MSIEICNTQGKRWNGAARSYIDLKEGEVWCHECKGAGQFPSKPIGNFDVSEQCRTCEGYGKLDWVERIVGKKNPFDFQTMLVNELGDALRNEIDEMVLDDLYAERNK